MNIIQPTTRTAVTAILRTKIVQNKRLSRSLVVVPKAVISARKNDALHRPLLRRAIASKTETKYSAQEPGRTRQHEAPLESVREDEHLIAYQTPTKGLLSCLPKTWIPYAELARLDKPTGTYYLFLPCLFSTLVAAPLANPIATPSSVLGTSALFFAGALIMRGAGCTINDMWDRNLDPHVVRTRLRPIARGAVSIRQAVPFLGAQLLAGLAVLLQFPHECLYYAVPSLLFVGVYPLAKRVTNYPQFVLGVTFSWGAFLGFPTLGIDLLSNFDMLASAASLYASCIAWTIVYDMIYAYQDIKDDAKIGIKSIARAQEANGKAFLSIISLLQVGLLSAAGASIGASPVFYGGACGGAAASLAYMIKKVNLKSASDCWAWFQKSAWYTGGAISAGLAGEYLVHYFGLYERSSNPDGAGESDLDMVQAKQI